MAIAIAPLGGLTGILRTIADTDADATPERNVADGATSVYAVFIDNNANAAIEYLKFYDNADPTVGTTAPDMILMVTASTRALYVFRGGIPFATALSFAAVTAPGTAGVTGPTSDMAVVLFVK